MTRVAAKDGGTDQTNMTHESSRSSPLTTATDASARVLEVFAQHLMDWQKFSHSHEQLHVALKAGAQALRQQQVLAEQILEWAQGVEDCAEGAHHGINAFIHDMRIVADQMLGRTPPTQEPR